MWLFDQLAEKQIRDAFTRGEFEHLPGAGKPLELEDDRTVPADLRAGFRLLKKAGCVPPELALRREIADVRSLLAALDDPDARSRTLRRLDLLNSRLAEMHGRRIDLVAERRYRDRLLEALDKRR